MIHFEGEHESPIAVEIFHLEPQMFDLTVTLEEKSRDHQSQ